jgi:hypothetical protein
VKLEIFLTPAYRNCKCQKCKLVIPKGNEKVSVSTISNSVHIEGSYHKECFYLDYKEVLTEIICRTDGSIDIKRDNERLYTANKDLSLLNTQLKEQLRQVTTERDRCLRIHNETINGRVPIGAMKVKDMLF